jgi:signal transduction histidine kinase
MEKLVKQIMDSYNAMIEDAKAQLEKGNKAAGTRARKSSLELEKMLKEFRKVSIEAAKK